MQHHIPSEPDQPRREAMAAAVQACVHCGFCLPGCPTYRVLGQEMDSPRGRIVLMKEVLEGNLSADEAQQPIDRCLGCLACETNCPSGVRYSDLLHPYRAEHPATRKKWGPQLRSWLAATTLPYPTRFRWSVRLGRIGRKLRSVTPSSLRPMLDLVPDRVPRGERLPAIVPAEGQRRLRVGLLSGCAQQVLAPQINHAAIRVLTNNGVEVVIPPSQVCCGALAWHGGRERQAMRFARQNLAAFDPSLDAIVTTAAGCGSGLHDYPLILRGTEQQAQAESFANKTIDISVLLIRIGLAAPPKLNKPLRVAYHDACHLQHAQGVRSEPRRLLAQIPGVECIEIPDGEICCGSAGTYNLEHPKIAAALGREKAEKIIQTGADLVVLGNIGCQVQIERYLRELGSPIPVMHLVELLDRVYQATDPQTDDLARIIHDPSAAGR